MAETSISSRDKDGHAGASDPRGAHGVKDTAYEEASLFAAKAKEAASSAVAKTKDVASSVVLKAEDVASVIGHQAEGAVDAVGGEMKSLAGTIREKAPRSGVLGSSAAGVASTLESGGAYLQEHNLHGIAEDATSLIRRYPLQAILAGIGVGFLVGRASRS